MTIHLRIVGIGLVLGMVGAAAPAGPPLHRQVIAKASQGTGHPSERSVAHNGHSMRAMLTASASVVLPDPPRSIALYDGLAKVNFPITTAQPLAQRYFNQGLAFAYGFNHAGAIASFREAQRIDPGCAMCWWGEAFAYGPNINAPMDSQSNARAFGTASWAQWLARSTTPLERALTAAMVRRYSIDSKADRAALDAVFADAMVAVAAAYPEHDDTAVIAAEAAMNTRPWDYWREDKAPHPRIGEAVSLVERVMNRNPAHAQAAHLYIHLMENGPDPRLAEVAADRLNASLAPASGHLVHMPAHIYFRLGRWQDSIKANLAAAQADEEWIRQSGDRGLVRYGYYPHNVHFIVTSAQMSGAMPIAMREARKLSRLLDPEISARIAWIQAVNAAPFFAAAQFSTPAEILALPAPDTRLPYPNAMRHYARAVARAQQGDRKGFDLELAALRSIRKSDALAPMIAQGVPATELLRLAETIAQARFDYASGRFAAASAKYHEAIGLESSIPYMEPPFWYFPVSQSLGAALYRSGRFEAAHAAFTAALAQSPNNGWALYGLEQAARKLGRREEAAKTRSQLNSVWAGNPRWLTMDRL